MPTPTIGTLIGELRPELSDADQITLSDEIAQLIEHFTASEVGDVTYVVIHYRDWLKTKYATSGFTPSDHRFRAVPDDSEKIADLRTSSGSLWEGIVWKETAHGDAESLAVLEKAASRAANVHRVCRGISNHGHGLFLKRFWADADPKHDLITDADPETVITALKRKDARELARLWGYSDSLVALTRTDTAYVVRAVEKSQRRGFPLLGADGPTVIAFSERALAAHRAGTEFEDFIAAESASTN